MKWTYFAVLGARTNGDPATDATYGEITAPTAADAVAAGIALSGKTVAHVRARYPEIEIREHAIPDDAIVIGYPVMRFDGEDEDSTWMLNGGLRDDLLTGAI